jgi:hypothetical protein
MDDNLQPYQKAYLDSPTSNYKSDYRQSKIIHSITPLYPKIYLEAFEAKQYCVNLLESNDLTNGVFRTFLTSSRSFKDTKLRSKEIPLDYKEYIAELLMPKFIWVCELSDIKHLSDEKCYCTIILDATDILDATEPNIYKFKPLLFIHLEDRILLKEKGSLTSHQVKEPLKQYKVYQNNLNGF